MSPSRSWFATRRRLATRNGVQVIEMILALPILLLATLITVQWAMAIVVSQTVQSAVADAARESAQLSSTATIQDRLDHAVAVTQQHLAVHGIPLSNVNPETNRITVADGDTGETATYGDLSLPNPASMPGVGELSVSIVIEVESTPIPNLLTTFGVSWDSSNLEASASVVK